ncbi:hypothetical protein COEREDRAFT_89375 [Coemansia reversa NRRL 1564]|uniref:Uncharacterized protein n=1 Tax=Coemansia reversa (strain ATCC 12441 / NRRL 1564) TaxID=763665 RepID=A0A2G5B404_COERN|nr:hypothetical protein COEREDRAFT_89375 [Coemansia reversa NRRL 1564]|eukprot:PIA13740.1 hypothetical protein COEREDRAFT_89375 [Coemansia reversa NRRL 1564]
MGFVVNTIFGQIGNSDVQGIAEDRNVATPRIIEDGEYQILRIYILVSQGGVYEPLDCIDKDTGFSLEELMVFISQKFPQGIISANIAESVTINNNNEDINLLDYIENQESLIEFFAKNLQYTNYNEINENTEIGKYMFKFTKIGLSFMVLEITIR